MNTLTPISKCANASLYITRLIYYAGVIESSEFWVVGKFADRIVRFYVRFASSEI
jgi:hypothetical protein